MDEGSKGTKGISKRRILLVYPKYPDTFWSFRYALKYIRRKAAFPPLGLLTIASMLPKEWEVRLVDQNVRKLTDAHLKWSDMVWLSAMEVQKEGVREVVAHARKVGRPVVAGGPMFTANHRDYEGIDHLILDEAEVTLPQFLRDLQNGTPMSVYSSDERPDLGRTPIPRWDLIRLKDYGTLLIQFSRGCPFNCEFCDIAMINGRFPRTKTVSRMIAELQAVLDRGYRGSVFIVDDNFIGNRRSVKELLREMVRWQEGHGRPFTFLTEASVDIADDEELMDLMVLAGFNKVFLGIETPDRDSLKECGKFQNLRNDLSTSILRVHRKGMQVLGGFIVGFDNDTPSIFQRQLEFIQSTGITTAMVGLLNAPPGTALWKRLKREGRLIGESTGSNTDGTLNFIPRMDREELVTGYRKLVSTLYSYKNYYKRADLYLKHYRPGSRGRISGKDIAAFFRSVLRIGVFSTASFYYWRLILKTLVLRRYAFPMAVEIAIYGHHFNRLSTDLFKTIG